MEYLLYIVLILAIGLGCVAAIWFAPRVRKTPSRRPAGSASSRTGNPADGQRGKAAGNWLRQAARPRRVNGDLSQNPRFRRNVRALLEDRYGRVRHDTKADMRYRKLKPRDTRDPQAPFDQMDPFGAGEAGRMEDRLPTARTTRVGAGASRELKDVRQPWGW